MIEVSFQIIVFNALKTLPKNMFKACIENIYPFAKEIVIVEGAVKPTNDNRGDASSMTSTGHSEDGTIEFLENYSDPEHKIILPKHEGFYYGKTAMCNEAIKHMSGDYIWQIDSDEFYIQEDMIKMFDILDKERPDIVGFFANQFGFDMKHCADERDKGWINLIPWWRIFKREGGCRWKTHAPPVLVDKNGIPINKKVISREETLKMGIKLFHFSMVNEQQVAFKNEYYKAGGTNYLAMREAWLKNPDLVLLGGDKFREYKGNYPQIIQDYYKNWIVI